MKHIQKRKLLDDSYLNLRMLSWPRIFEIPVEKFSSDLKKALSNGTVSWGQKYELMTHLASEIAQYTENPTVQQRSQVAEALLEAFPQLKSNSGENNHTYVSLWETRIYDKMKEFRRKKGKATGINIKTPKLVKSHKIQHWQTRGLINWHPPPPEGENNTTMSVHKHWLKHEYVKVNSCWDNNMITKKMELCFSYRREEINSNVFLSYIKREYPFMFTTEGIFKEFQLLMRIDVEKTFLSNAIIIAPSLIKFALERKKPPVEMQNILNEFTSKPEQEKVLNNIITTSLLILPFLFAESDSLMYKIYPIDTSVQEIKTGPTSPHVAVIGSPYTSSQVFVIADGEIIIECSAFVQAIIACLAVYYCCNVKYPDEAKYVYYFMQMQLLKLEHYGKSPRKVITLVEKLNQCIN